MSNPIEFSRIVDVARLSTLKEVTYTATPEECAALAKRIGALSIQDVHVRARYTPQGKGILMTGTLTAHVTLACVATLQPLPQAIETSLEILLISNAPPMDNQSLEDLEGPDTESFEGTLVDVGELFAQYLCLATPVYPRSDGVPVEHVETSPNQNPFSILKDL